MTRLGRLHLNSAGLCAIRMKALIDYWQIDELLLGECTVQYSTVQYWQIDELLLGEWRHTAGTAAVIRNLNI